MILNDSNVIGLNEMSRKRPPSRNRWRSFFHVLSSCKGATSPRYFSSPFSTANVFDTPVCYRYVSSRSYCFDRVLCQRLNSRIKIFLRNMIIGHGPSHGLLRGIDLTVRGPSGITELSCFFILNNCIDIALSTRIERSNGRQPCYRLAAICCPFF